MKTIICHLLLLLTTLALTACDKEKIPLTGTRVPVVNYESSVKIDTETQDLIVSLPLTESSRDWPQAGGGPDHVMPHFSLKDSVELFRTVSIGEGKGEGRFLSAPIVAEGNLFALDTLGTVTAIQTSSGEILWQTSVSPQDQGGPIIGGGLAYGGGKVFVTSPHAKVFGLDAKTGEIKWQFSTPSPIRAAPTLADGRLYVLTISNQLYVLDAEKGTPLWNHAGITEHAGLLGTASPAVSKGIAVVAYSSGEIYALKAENGHQLWTETISTTRRPDSLSSLSHIKALPIIHQNLVIIIGHNHKMAAYDLRRGERVWERHIGGTRTPAVIGDFIYMINSHNELLCLTVKHGQVVWVKKLPTDSENPQKVVWQGPLVAGGKLYLVSTYGALIAIDPTDGKVMGERTLGVPISLHPFAAQDTLYLLTDEGDVIAFQ
jgi:outer membrane protein assembly factor BamB